MITLYCSGLVGSEIWTKISGISTFSTCIVEGGTIDDELTSEFFVTQRLYECVKWLDFRFLCLQQELEGDVYEALVPVTAQGHRFI